ncbi:stage III sporulation protein AG [Niallia nealsonii]|uniref:Stage III sporulation protein AG n=1 Tax=Niallia nealsonii TaxID=115979 RepID=A0A2N0Z8C2_9BACI|nr:stage III sporulation protein AG [Niallia nealsonii]PKG25744.1 stage III sporulation protein AG [Niallia nealsonii]
MDKEKGPISSLKRIFTNNGGPGNKQGKVQYLIIVALFGAAIMLLSNMFFHNDSTKEAATVTSSPVAEETFGQKSQGSSGIIDYEEKYKEEIKAAINNISGVKNATVYVNVDATEKKIYEKNTTTQNQTTEETDPQGGKRQVEDASTESQLVIVQNGDKQVPVVVETKKPEIRGVLIVAKGAENIKIKSMIIEAVTRALDVPSHRVSVMPKQS